MIDILSLTTSAAWRKLNRLCAADYQKQEIRQENAKFHAINYLSLAPYSTADGSHELAEVANKDISAACNLSLYRASLLFTYKHIINKDYQMALEECNHAITYLQEGLNLLGIATDLKQNDLRARARSFVNSLASQAELQDARKKNKIASHLFFVLGMHRSGTSALTGMLAQAGFTMPSDLMPATEANPKGYWESLGIMRLNEEFLAGMESHWTSSLPLPEGWSQSINSREWRTSLIKIIAESFRGAQLPAIKDPRFCTLILGLEPWLESRLIYTSFFIPIRHPLEVCNSLRKAEGIELNKALRLWIKSIFMTEEVTRGYPRKFLSFEELIQNPINVLETCLQLVENTADPEIPGRKSNNHNAIRTEALSSATAFIEKSLKRQRAVISERDIIEVKNICNTKLIELAEAIYRAIIANITDDKAISKSLDELWPSLSDTSG
jgi:hypothetical protein